LRRELREEVGLERFTLGPLVWRCQHTFDWLGRRLCQTERYHLIETERFTPKMSDPVESRTIDLLRWWTLDELRTTPERLTPLSLPRIIDRLLQDGPPRGEIDVEVLVD
jgi:hypothetical protein